MASTSPIRVGVVGAGLSATVFHLPFLTTNPSYRITKVLRNTVKEVPGYKHLQVTDSPEAFFAADDLDLVVVTTPTHQHYGMAAKALRSGLHVVLEKPMCASFQEAQQLCQIAKQENRVLAVYQNRRWDGDFSTAQSILNDGLLGRVVEYESHFDRHRHTSRPSWKEDVLPGNGLIYSIGSHLIDQALVLFGTPDRLTAQILHQRQLPVDDAFILHLHYDNYPATEPPSGPTTADPAETSYTSRSSGTEVDAIAGTTTAGGSGSGSQEAGSSGSAGGARGMGGQGRGLAVTLHASMLNSLPGPRFLLHGTRGSFVKYGLDPQEGKLMQGVSPTTPGFGVDDSSSSSSSIGKLQLQLEGGVSNEGEVRMLPGCYSRFYENVAEVVRSGDMARLAVKPEEAAAVIRLIELAKQSSEEQRTLPVEVWSAGSYQEV